MSSSLVKSGDNTTSEVRSKIDRIMSQKLAIEEVMSAVCCDFFVAFVKKEIKRGISNIKSKRHL
jgi:hypothetical protein